MKISMVIILAFAMVFTTFLTTGCSTTEEVEIFDFTGAWTLNTTWDGYTENNPMTLAGSLTNGLVTIPGFTGGTYTSANNQMTITFYLGPLIYSFTGTVTATNYMSGTFTTNLMPGTGTWQAVR